MEQLALIPLQDIKSQRHFVHIHWRRDGEEHFESYRLNRKNALSLLAELQKVTGKDWETVDFSEKVDPGHTNRILRTEGTPSDLKPKPRLTIMRRSSD